MARKKYTGGVKISYGKKTPAEKKNLVDDFKTYGFASAAEFKAKLESPSAPKAPKAAKAAKAAKASGGKGRGRKKKSEALKAATYEGLTVEELNTAIALIEKAKKNAPSSEETAAKAAEAKAEQKRLNKIKRLEAQLAKLKG